MKTFLTVLAATAAIATAFPVAQAAEGDTVLRLRAIQIDPDVDSNIPGLDLDQEVTGEIAITSFLSPHWAIDLGVSWAQHDIQLNGNKVGEAEIWPINLILQFHFTREGPIRPYIGAGVNYTRFDKITVAGGEPDAEKNSVGPVAQLGIDVPLGDRLLLNFDAKKFWAGTELNGVPNGDIDIDPWVFGAGIGIKF
jgi:outer membrane protein